MTRSKAPSNVASELLCRAGRELLLLQHRDASAHERLSCTLDEAWVALMATPHEVAAEALRNALPESLDRVNEAVLRALTEALELLQRQLGCESGSAPAAACRLGGGDGAARLDAETVSLFTDFISESEEGLQRVDEILLAADQAAPDAERINELFRVFHTIKGVAGFLEASDVTGVAHVTETLLDQVRSGKRVLAGPLLEVVFEASASLRNLLSLLRQALLGDQVMPSLQSTALLCTRIEQLIAQRSSADGSSAAPASLPAIAFEAAEPLAGSEPAPVPLLPTPDAAPRASEPRSGAAGANPGRVRETIKVDLERIDSVVEMIGELIIVESMVAHAPEVLGIESLKIRNYLAQLTKISRDLQSVAMRMRMVPVRGVFQKMARMTRDLARKTGKRVQLEQLGDATEMDRSMVERIEDPLMHMIRNAVDHAIAEPAARAAAGKPQIGTIRLSARHEGGSVVIEIADDGEGLRRDKILQKARQRGLVGEDSEQLSDEEVFGLIFLPGFSTAEQVSELSGRGVGMDVVKRGVESMRGRVTVSSSPGVGTRFRLTLPLTLAIIDGMLVACGEERYIVPSLSIVESLQPRPGMVRTLGADGELINVRGEILPLLRLGRLFQQPGAEPSPEHARVVVLESAGRKLGLLVDDVITQQQIVIKPLGTGLCESELLAGAAILSDGRVGLIVNVDRLSGQLGPRRGHYDTSEVAA